MDKSKLEKIEKLIGNLTEAVEISDKNWESDNRNEWQIVSQLQETLEYAIWSLELIKQGREDEC